MDKLSPSGNVYAGLLIYRLQRNTSEFLLLNDSFSHKRHWTVPKGRVIGNEDLIKCALRETLELTGIPMKDLRVEENFKVEIKYLSGTRPKNVAIFLARLSDHGRILPSGEGYNISWFNLQDAMEKALYRSMQDVIKQASSVVELRRVKSPTSPSRTSSTSMGSLNEVENRFRSMNIALPLDSQRQAIARNRGEPKKERGNQPREHPHQRESRDRDREQQQQQQQQQREQDNPLYKTRLCERFETEGHCPYGPKCTFAHGTAELRERPAEPERTVAARDGPGNPLYKTRLCERFMKDGFCQYGPKCNFAHGTSELRERPKFERTNGGSGSESGEKDKERRDGDDRREVNMGAPAGGQRERDRDVQEPTHVARSEILNDVPSRAASTAPLRDAPPPVQQTDSPAVKEELPKAPEMASSPNPSEASSNAKPAVASASASATARRRGEDKVSLKEFLSGQHEVEKEKTWMKVVELSPDDRLKFQSAKKPEAVQAPDTKSTLDDTLAQELKAFFLRQQERRQTLGTNNNKGIMEDTNEVARMEVRYDLSKPQLFKILLRALFDEVRPEGAMKVLSPRKGFFAAFIRSPADQFAFVSAWEKYINKRNSVLLPKIAVIFKWLYDNDLIEEETFLRWHEETTPEGVGSNGVKQKCSVFINWLKSAEEEDDA
ncbi:uncharacterized protein VTP21DRAFT_10492 [Calcarisporiella thermophila]|uniref:uncharacterized protein n=1 Tax=Calcarisporiella thermophila TaxID=911321 RepID=UPI0037440424